ncbi:histidine phosphatase superfamily [Echria macrotheca]|uniref:Histidine phosphatase superfamily n=1 Tax=Echria macrotheca TaxID=438768 RepID=A0AAJ0FGF6_9PEZI|nr:histidine phosphatase superfamily [Echria macrotheca]
MADNSGKWKYTALQGFFAHYDGPTGPSHEATTTPGLGLLPRTYPTDSDFDPDGTKQPWERFAFYLSHLNQTAPPGTSYKLFYTARHGEGFHNVKEAEVGTEAWEAYWAKLEGDGKITWSDACLTEKGTAQAKEMHTFWAESSSTLSLPLPKKHYASPLARCLDTCALAFSDLPSPAPEFKPIIKEMARERLGVHTCDRRHPRSWIERNYGEVFSLEDGFAEEDELWRPDVRETLGEHAGRIARLLDGLWEDEEEEEIVSLTVHSGSILAMYEVVGHPEVRVAPGAVVPLFVKGERVV